MGSGHFLVEACSFMAEKLYEACRLCDEKAMELERKWEKEKDSKIKENINKEINIWRDRILELPDPDDEIMSYLPSSAPEAWRSGLSQNKALALCKRLVAIHCLYGVDKNLLAVELAKLSLWLETQSEGLPLTFLDHRLILGDSITGPFFEHLLKYPGSQESLEGIFLVGIQEKLEEAFKNGLMEICELEKSIGINLSDIENKKISKEKLENTLLPFKVLAAAWAGGVMLGQNGCDDFEYGKLAKKITEDGKLPDDINSRKLLVMISKGLGIEEEELNFQEILERVKQGKIIPALPYDLTFPEVFFELTDVGLKRKGFDVVLGNPPWDKMLPAVNEFLARYDLKIFEGKTRYERKKVIDRILSSSDILVKYKSYISNFREKELIIGSLYHSQQIEVNGEMTIGKQDLFRLFVERTIMVSNSLSMVGLVLPSAFHNSESATGIRKLLIENKWLTKCIGFINKKKFFEISPGFKFDLIVVSRKNELSYINAIFNLEEDIYLFSDVKELEFLRYKYDFIFKSGGAYFSLLELSSVIDLEIIQLCFLSGVSFKTIASLYNIKFGRELNMSDDSWRFVRTERLSSVKFDPRIWDNDHYPTLKNKYIPLHEKGTFDKYNDLIQDYPRYCVELTNMLDKLNLLKSAKYYRFICRAAIHASEKYKSVFCIIPPGVTSGHSANTEKSPWERPNYLALIITAIANSFSFDYMAHTFVGLNFSQFIFNRIPFPKHISLNNIIAHSVLRLVSNHVGFEYLWKEQLGNIWREPNKKTFIWPVLETEEERWNVRSAIDAVVADAYGLNREQYEHILKSFDRASGPNPYTVICLEKYDELKKIGLEKYARKYDPYWDIPLNEELPSPVIEIPLSKEEETQQNMF